MCTITYLSNCCVVAEKSGQFFPCTRLYEIVNSVVQLEKKTKIVNGHIKWIALTVFIGYYY